MLTGRLFQVYDPYMTFCPEAPGYERGLFRTAEGEPVLPGQAHSQQYRSVWIGADRAYHSVSSTLDGWLTTQGIQDLLLYLGEYVELITPIAHELLAPGKMAAHDPITFESVRPSRFQGTDILIILATLELFHTQQAGGAEPIHLHLDDGAVIGLETVLYVIAIAAADDCLVAEMLARGRLEALTAFQRYLADAEGLASAKAAAKLASSAVRTSQARKAAKARAEKYYDRAGAILEWNINGPAYSSAAAFARQRHKDFNYTDPAHLARIIRRDGKKHPKKLK